jgi:hypothetical protein
LFERLPGEAVLNIDETGHKEYREKFWTWCFRAQLYTLFRIDCGQGGDFPSSFCTAQIGYSPQLTSSGERKASRTARGTPYFARKSCPSIVPRP